MELIVRIKEQGALVEREITNNQTGQKEKFAVMPFELIHGDCTFYCEMIQDTARRQPVLSKDYYYVATIQAGVFKNVSRETGEEYRRTRLTLTKLCVL